VSANGHVTGNLAVGYNASNDFVPPNHQPPRPIAICGMGMRLPGGIRDSESFWDTLANGKDARGPIPADRYNVNGFSDALGKKGAIQTKFGYFINDDLTTLDTSFFSMSKAELERIDPQQRQLLEVTRETLENAGEVG
jgi:acyl transferase domain-containing protein